MELKEQDLDNVLAGNLKGVSQDEALKNESLFRNEKIEELKREKEELLDSEKSNNEFKGILK